MDARRRVAGPRTGRARFVAAALLLLVAAPAGAFVDSSTPVGEVGDRRFAVSVGGVELRVPCFANHPLSRGHATARRAVIVIHGADRGAGHNYRGMCAAATTAREETPSGDLFSLRGWALPPPADEEEACLRTAVATLVFAPLFPTFNDVDHHGLGASVPYWASNGWYRGRASLDEAPHERAATVTSFEVVDRMIERLVDRDRFPRLEHIVVAGHSAGGQFVHRYAAVNEVHERVEARGLTLRYVVANPSSYLYPSRDRLVPYTDDTFAPPRASVRRTTCPGFDDWHYGLTGVDGYAAHVAEGLRRFVYAVLLARREVSYLLGEEDDDPCSHSLATGCAAMLQGRHRVERGYTLYRYLRWGWGDGILRTHRWATVPGAAHGSRPMWTSDEGRHALFDTPPPALRAPTPIEPAVAVGVRTPTWRWYAVPGATWYRLVVDGPGDDDFAAWITDDRAGCEAGVICATTPSVRLRSGPYTWTVHAWRAGELGPASGPVTFSPAAPPAPTTHDPPSWTERHRPTFAWSPVPGAHWYDLVVVGADGARWGAWYPAEDVCCKTRCEVRPERLLRDETYEWYVYPYNEAGFGTPSPTDTVTPYTEPLPWGGEYRLHAVPTRFVLDADSRTADEEGGAVQVWSDHGGANQRWYLDWVTAPGTGMATGEFTIKLVASGLCLAVRGDARDPTVALTACDETDPAQQWDPSPAGDPTGEPSDGYLALRNVDTDLCLGVGSARVRDGAAVVARDCGDTWGWLAEPVE